MKFTEATVEGTPVYYRNVSAGPLETYDDFWNLEYVGDTAIGATLSQQVAAQLVLGTAVSAVHAQCKVTFNAYDVAFMKSSTGQTWIYATLWMLARAWGTYPPGNRATCNPPEKNKKDIRVAVKLMFTRQVQAVSLFSPRIPSLPMKGKASIVKGLDYPMPDVPETYKFSTNGPPAYTINLHNVDEFSLTDTGLHASPLECVPSPAFYVNFALLHRFANPTKSNPSPPTTLLSKVQTPYFYYEKHLSRYV